MSTQTRNVPSLRGGRMCPREISSPGDDIPRQRATQEPPQTSSLLRPEAVFLETADNGPAERRGGRPRGPMAPSVANQAPPFQGRRPPALGVLELQAFIVSPPARDAPTAWRCQTEKAFSFHSVAGPGMRFPLTGRPIAVGRGPSRWLKFSLLRRAKKWRYDRGECGRTARVGRASRDNRGRKQSATAAAPTTYVGLNPLWKVNKTVSGHAFRAKNSIQQPKVD
jgi:hypothetical protein